MRHWGAMCWAAKAAARPAQKIYPLSNAHNAPDQHIENRVYETPCTNEQGEHRCEQLPTTSKLQDMLMLPVMHSQ